MLGIKVSLFHMPSEKLATDGKRFQGLKKLDDFYQRYPTGWCKNWGHFYSNICKEDLGVQWGLQLTLCCLLCLVQWTMVCPFREIVKFIWSWYHGPQKNSRIWFYWVWSSISLFTSDIVHPKELMHSCGELVLDSGL